MNIRKAEVALAASPDLQELVAGLLARIDALEAEATTKACTPTGNTVKGAISDVIKSENASRRASAVRKDIGGSEHPHFLSETIRKRRADREAELQRIADEGARATIQALRAKAGLL